jgi:hypothetical protein
MLEESPDHKVVHTAVSPVVYFDQWALYDISENQTLADRLTAALKARNGTLALSWINLTEFRTNTREEQARKAESLIEAMLPQVFFLEVTFEIVIGREDRLLTSGAPVSPHEDADFLRTFIGLKRTSQSPLTAQGLFRSMQQDSQRGQYVDAYVSAIADGINTLRRRYAAVKKTTNLDSFLNCCGFGRPSVTGLQIGRATRFIFYELFRAPFVDMRKRISRNDVMDLFQAIVPVAYCDFVLLDNYWKTQVERALTRIKKVVPSAPIARVFSGKANGIDRFLCEVESGR